MPLVNKMEDLENKVELEKDKVQSEKGTYIVESKFSVMHYQSNWPPYEQRESTTPAHKRSRFTSGLLKKKFINKLRKDITTKTFSDLYSVRDYVLNFIKPLITEEDFGDMAKVEPHVNFSIGKNNFEYGFHWYNPENKCMNDPWFAINVTKRNPA